MRSVLTPDQVQTLTQADDDVAGAKSERFAFQLARTRCKELEWSEMTAPEEVPTDERLVKAALSGNDEAFTELVRRHKRKVFTIVARFVRNTCELDDVCQESWARTSLPSRNRVVHSQERRRKASRSRVQSTVRTLRLHGSESIHLLTRIPGPSRVAASCPAHGQPPTGNQERGVQRRTAEERAGWASQGGPWR